MLDLGKITLYNKSRSFVEHLGVAQLVARYLGVVEAASSSLVTQTKKSEWTFVHSDFLICVMILNLRPIPHQATPKAALGVVG